MGSQKINPLPLVSNAALILDIPVAVSYNIAEYLMSGGVGGLILGERTTHLCTVSPHNLRFPIGLWSTPVSRTKPPPFRKEWGSVINLGAPTVGIPCSGKHGILESIDDPTPLKASQSWHKGCGSLCDRPMSISCRKTFPILGGSWIVLSRVRSVPLSCSTRLLATRYPKPPSWLEGTHAFNTLRGSRGRIRIWLWMIRVRLDKKRGIPLRGSYWSF